MAKTFQSFAAFWPYYLREHADARTRGFHYVGTTLGMALLLAFLATLDWRLLIAAPIAGYAFAWIAHAFIERNRPATFTHPLWSLMGDYRMLWCWATGRLPAELARAGVAPAGAPVRP
jgi:hypothetical protein